MSKRSAPSDAETPPSQGTKKSRLAETPMKEKEARVNEARKAMDRIGNN